MYRGGDNTKFILNIVEKNPQAIADIQGIIDANNREQLWRYLRRLSKMAYPKKLHPMLG
jgi:hypothetical protein